jgi:hypothetical protein
MRFSSALSLVGSYINMHIQTADPHANTGNAYVYVQQPGLSRYNIWLLYWCTGMHWSDVNILRTSGPYDEQTMTRRAEIVHVVHRDYVYPVYWMGNLLYNRQLRAEWPNYVMTSLFICWRSTAEKIVYIFLQNLSQKNIVYIGVLQTFHTKRYRELCVWCMMV